MWVMWRHGTAVSPGHCIAPYVWSSDEGRVEYGQPTIGGARVPAAFALRLSGIRSDVSLFMYLTSCTGLTCSVSAAIMHCMAPDNMFIVRSWSDVWLWLLPGVHGCECTMRVPSSSVCVCINSVVPKMKNVNIASRPAAIMLTRLVTEAVRLNIWDLKSVRKITHFFL